MKRSIIAPALFVLAAASALAQPELPQPKEKGIESGDYVWNEMKGEKLLALQAQGDPVRGEISFEICQGCHRRGALGRLDGTYPRLAGQHASVLIKQMTDVRAGRRDNQRMFPFADKHVIGPQDIADIAIYLRALPVPADNGKGPGTGLDRGRELYARDCASCHGDAGEGSGDKFYPRVSGQHYNYLLREGLAIRDGERRNGNPKMVKVIRTYSDAEIQMVSDYMSRFPVAPR